MIPDCAALHPGYLLAIVTAYLIAHPIRATRRVRHSAAWIGWESLRRRGARLSVLLMTSHSRLCDELAAATGLMK